MSDRTEAEKLANDIDADLVIYGKVVNDGYETLFSPEFYAPRLTEGEEIIDARVLRRRIPVDQEDLTVASGAAPAKSRGVEMVYPRPAI